MIFLFTKMYFTPTNTTAEFQSTNTQGAIPTTQYDRLRSNVGDANDIANQQRTKADELNRVINSLQ